MLSSHLLFHCCLATESSFVSICLFFLLVHSQDDRNGLYDNRLWLRLLAYFSEGYLMGCGNPANTTTAATPASLNSNAAITTNSPAASSLPPNLQRTLSLTSQSGIIAGHAYSILDIKEYNSVRLLKLRNPWGEGEWKGDWSDISPLWTSKLRKLFNYPKEEVDADDGVFWISYSDFISHFQRVYICRLFENVEVIQTPDDDSSADSSEMITSLKHQDVAETDMQLSNNNGRLKWYRQM